jgi:pimeloyl-ACP methyl ester carboxylesterase
MVDHRGHGLSALGDIRFDVADDADDLAGVLDAQGVG